MTIRKRLSDILTPPTWLYTPSPASETTPSSPPPETGPSLSEVGPLLKELLMPGEVPEQTTRGRLGRLKEISSKYGCLQVAREIRDTVQRMPEIGTGGVPYKKNRGYDLACDLFLQHARKRLDGADSKAALYDVVTVSEEIQHCLFASKRHVKGIDLGLDLMESVLERMCTGSEGCGDYMQFAQEIVGRTLDAALASDEARRALRPGKRTEDDGAEIATIPAPVLEYLSAVSERLKQLRRRLGSEPAPAARARAEFLSHVSQDAATTMLHGLAARSLEEFAAFVKSTDADRAQTLRKHAFTYYEKARVEASGIGLRFSAHRFAQGAARVER